jgi:hypothetical protein
MLASTTAPVPADLMRHLVSSPKFRSSLGIAGLIVIGGIVIGHTLDQPSDRPCPANSPCAFVNNAPPWLPEEAEHGSPQGTSAGSIVIRPGVTPTTATVRIERAPLDDGRVHTQR